MMIWVQANWSYIATVLFGLSEIIGAMPQVKASGVFSAVVNMVLKAVGPKAKEAVEGAVVASK